MLVRVGVQMPFGIGCQAELGAQLSLGVAGLVTGRFVFDYTCTLSDGCLSNEDPTDPSDDTTVRFEVDGLPDFTWGVTAQALAKPYAYVELWAYLYHPWFAAVGVGLEASLPSTVWYGYGEHCGDADGNNDAELVNGGYFDANAQLSLYWLYNIAGRSDYYWLDWDLSISLLDKWELYEMKHSLAPQVPVLGHPQKLVLPALLDRFGTEPANAGDRRQRQGWRRRQQQLCRQPATPLPPLGGRGYF